jgi:hypothetical protein
MEHILAPVQAWSVYKVIIGGYNNCGVFQAYN